MTESTESESLTAFPSWADRLTRAVRVWKFYDSLPDNARMDRVFKESGVRDLVVEREQLREKLARAAYLAENLHGMIDRETWRARGGDDQQGHYEGDAWADDIAIEIRALKEAARA